MNLAAALKAAGCGWTYREKASGGRWDRPGLHRLLDQLREADVIRERTKVAARPAFREH